MRDSLPECHAAASSPNANDSSVNMEKEGREGVMGEGNRGTRAMQSQAAAADNQGVENTRAEPHEEPSHSREEPSANSGSARGSSVVVEKHGTHAVKPWAQQSRSVSPAKRPEKGDENGQVNQRLLLVSSELLMKDSASYEDAKRAARERGRIKAMEKEAERKRQSEKVCLQCVMPFCVNVDALLASCVDAMLCVCM